MSVPSLAIGGPSPRVLAALAAVTPRLLALAYGESSTTLFASVYRSSSSRTSG
jgi:hypothetical protein